MAGSGLLDLPAWRALAAHQRDLAERSLRELFAEDPGRVGRLTFEAAGLRADLSKHRVTDETLRLLLELAEARDVTGRRDAMFRGEHLNVSEDRAVLHVALRMPEGRRLVVDGVDVVAQVHEVLGRMRAFAREVRSGRWRGATGRPVRNVVNIGIGGSDLGPAMAAEALAHYRRRDLRFRFVSNVDPTDLAQALADLDPAETLFIVSSKTFTTTETLTNARAARQWLVDRLGEEAVAKHFVAVSTNEAEVRAFGIDPTRMFGFWDWVGGRYSMDSAIGLSTMLAIGPEGFDELLAGFRAMDEHFQEAPLRENLPVLHGLLWVWYRDFFGCQTMGVMPYSQYLRRFPAYLQQLTMESNGKRVTLEGEAVDVGTGPVVWGEPGTNGQHSFYQLLHQGTVLVPVDLIGFARSLDPVGEQQDTLMANLLAQAEALAFGRSAEEVRAEGTPEALVPHKVMPGDRPSTVLLAEELTPRTLGSLVALYEHSVFVQGCIWGIDSFDQWGVELGKALAKRLVPTLQGDQGGLEALDPSTRALAVWYQQHREARPGGAPAVPAGGWPTPAGGERRLEVLADEEALAEAAASWLAERIRAALAARGCCRLALSGGRTPWAMLARLAALDLAWEQVEVFQVDERIAPYGSETRNLTRLEAILGRVGVRLRAMGVESPDLAAACGRYARDLPARFDVVHLGLGADGHTASLVPGDPVVEEGQQLVALSGPYQGERRMTLTRPALARGEAILWLVSGEEKRSALARLLAGDQGIPAGLVRGGEQLVLADQAAAGAGPSGS
jgi:glucose-6-phosphate isomerase